MEVDGKAPSPAPVVVIGCGAAGIAALSRLTRRGVRAVGVEASDRIGGRIRTVNFGAGFVDLGAAWCHGERDNIVFELANPLGLLGRPDPANENNNMYVFSDGSLMPTSNAEQVLNQINNDVEQNSHNLDSISQIVSTSRKIIVDGLQLPITESFKEWYIRDNNLGGEDDPLKGKSLAGSKDQKLSDGDVLFNWKGKGYTTLLNVLMNKHPGATDPLDIDIRYNKEVTNIYWNSEQDQSSVPTVAIKFRDGTTMNASNVIVTIPLGVLKHNSETMFTPPLPSEKVEAINNLQFCVLDKIYIEFETPWWPEELVNFNILWREEDKAKFEKENWVTGIYGLRKVEYQPKVLLAWMTGSLAKEMENVTEDQLKAGINKFITHVFSTNFKPSPVVDLKRSQWASNVYARGSYSYRAVTSEQCRSASAEVLSQPLTVKSAPLVCFAGEATSHKWYGNVHGAVDSGFREADRIIHYIASSD